ncbi:hypothetical protein SAMN05216570_3078 [Dyella sp. OK004]|uniref:T4 family baseplate hub assembly chaperone n=1 Tax=Dyella sp. OK004 TaxID=1855292 RepID=UPI0008EEC278|nr:hypothetical protein [Dyella sp. OK004]SFS14393.1 hypothetical protein SAMN05216570_3078 [Dyella sp. OK004]
MRTPSASELLHVWERGGVQSAVARGLALLDICCGENVPEALAGMPLGRRDALLLQLRARLFGTQLNGVASCPACGAMVEASFDCDGLLAVQGDAGDDAARILTLHSSVDDIQVRFRVPNSGDLLALEACADASLARQLLLERCLVDVEGAADTEPRSLSPELQAEMVQAMATADPQADVQLAFTCPGCEEQWQPMFDIARFLWQELHAWSLRVLRDVDTLARVYHWSEADILALSPRRRQAYLEQCVS